MFQRAPPDVNGFGRDDLDAGADQVVPALDVLRVAVANDEDDDGVRDHALVRLLLPLRVDLARGDELVHVGGERQRDDVGVEARLHRSRLLTGRAVGLREVDVLAGRGLLEQRDELPVGLARGGVGDEVELRARDSSGCGGADARDRCDSGCDESDRGDRGR